LSFAWLAALCVIATGAWAQPTDAVPLKNWAAPQYWQPSGGESALGKQKAEGRAAEVARVVSSSTVPLAGVSSAPLTFVALTPCRVVDTRTGSGFTGAFGPPSLFAGIGRTIPMQSSSTCSIPSTAVAYSLNITVVPPGPLGFITLWPTGLSRPLASTLNDLTGTIVANAAIVPAGTSGSIDVYASNNTDVIIDINGYYAATGAPLAFGAFDANGTRQSGSSNISCPWNAASSWYQCTITGEDYFYLSYVANVTPFNFAITRTSSVSGNLLIMFSNTAGTQIQLSSGFQVAVYKP
jgi:hypothetical protein